MKTWSIPIEDDGVNNTVMNELVLDHVVQYSVRTSDTGDWVRVATAAGEIVRFGAEHLESFQDALYSR